MGRIAARGPPAVLAVAVAAVAGATAGEEPLTLEQAITMALASNRALAAARLGADVARAAQDVARQRLNPDLGIEAARETPHEAYTLSFPIELGGKRQRRLDASAAASATTEAEIARLAAETRAA